MLYNTKKLLRNIPQNAEVAAVENNFKTKTFQIT